MGSAAPIRGDPGDNAQLGKGAFSIALALALTPFVVSVVLLATHGSGALIRDEALIELRVRDVGQHPVLIGLYSRDGWSHPGPLAFYTLAVPYRLLGSSAVGLLVGALLVNAAAVTGMAFVAKRIGGLSAALVTLIAAGIAAQALGAQVLFDPWVCFITVLPFGLFCYLVWAMTSGEIWALPVSVFVASWLVQAHIGYAPLTAPALVLGVVWLWLSVRRDAQPARMQRLVRAGVVAAVLLLLLWIPTLWDQWRGSGNLGKSIDWFTGGDAPAHSLAEGARIVLGQFAVAPDWIRGTRRIGFNGETTLIDQTLWPVLLIPLCLAAVLAWKRGRRDIVRLAAVTGFVVLVAVLAVARTIGIMYEYRLLWTWMLGILGTVVIAWTAWSIAAERWHRCERRLLVPLSITAVVALSVVQIVDVARSGSPDFYSTAAGQVTKQLSSEMRSRPGQVVLRAGSPSGEWYLQGLVLGLERAGIDARVAADPSQRFGAHRVQGSGPVGARFLVLADEDLIATPPPDLEVVAYSGATSLERYRTAARRVQADEQRLLARLRAGTLTPEVYLDRLIAMKRPGPTVAVLQERSSP